MRKYTIYTPQFDVYADGLKDLEKHLKSKDLFGKLRIANERLLKCTDCGCSMENNNARCDSCFNIWLNRRTSTAQWCKHN